MSSFDISIGIWWKAVVINAFVTCLWAVFEVEIFVVPLFFLMIVLGFVVAMPLLPLVTIFVKWQRSLVAYENHAKLSWFCSMMVMLVWGFYFLIWALTSNTNDDELILVCALSGSTSIAVLAAIYFHREDINELNQHYLAEKNTSIDQNLSHV